MTSPLGEPTPLPPAIEARLDEALRTRDMWVWEASDDTSEPTARYKAALEHDAARAALSAEIGKLVAAREAAEMERDEMRAIALKHSHHATATLDKRTRVLTGSLMIAGELLDAAKFDAITQCCIDLANKFRAEYAATRSTPRPPSR